ncbi:MAG: sulfotransferase [Sandaracinaceae bacterium]
MRETSTDYRHPYRPRAIAIANRVLSRLGSLQPSLTRDGSLRAETLLDAASKRTGLRDFGPDDFREPLDVLLRSIEDEARLSPVGRAITVERLTGVLANRLRAADASRSLGADTLAPPVVITGLQRTGTTLLHRLLSADPNRRWLASWEALTPTPLGGWSLGREPRIVAAERAERALQFLAPDFFAVHPVQAHAPEEDVLLLDQSFRSTVPEATLRVPTYAAWIEQQDQRPAYDTLRRLLRLLSRQRGEGKRWVLKTPHHLEWLDDLFAVFPGARVVWTHRDPVTTVASFCSMIAHGRGVFSDDVDPHEIGRDWGRKVARMVDRAMDARTRHPDAFIDVAYGDLVADPMQQIVRIYEALGEELTDEAERRMRQMLESHGQHRFGKHRYRLEDFGLREDALRERFAKYLARHIAP